MHRWVQKTCKMNSAHMHMQRIRSAPAPCACGMPPEHSAWAPFPRHAGQGLQALTTQKGARQRSPPPKRNWRQVAPGSPAKPDRHFNAASLREGSQAGKRRRTPHTHTGPPLGFSKQDQQDSAPRTTRGRCLEAVATRGRNIATHTSHYLAPPQIPEPPARPTASRRSGRRHAVLRRCAEATQAAN